MSYKDATGGVDRDLAEVAASSPLAAGCSPEGPQSLCCDASSMSHADFHSGAVIEVIGARNIE